MSARPPFQSARCAAGLALLVSVWVTGCGERAEVQSVEVADGGPCGRGKARSCECDDGRRGIAHCMVGSDWSECYCGDSFVSDDDHDGVRADDGGVHTRPGGGRDNPLGGARPSAACTQPIDVRAHSPRSKSEPYLVQRPLTQLGDGPAPICFYFSTPYPADERAVSFQPLPDETSRPLRWLLYGVDDAKHADGEVGPCSGTEPGAYLLAGFYPGSEAVALPSDVSLALPTGAKAGLVLALYYDTPKLVALLDRTGVRICRGDASKRPITAAVHVVGTEAICVPPARQGYEVSGTCAPRTDRGDIHILSVWPHMHQRGRRMQVSIKRADGSVEPLAEQTFPQQRATYPSRTGAVLASGDTLETRCWFDNSGIFPVSFGADAEDENCFAFVTAWPAGALTVDPAALDPLRALSLTERASRRCLDPFGILGSCNGLADSPY
jgi:hypothetical protein